MSSYIISKSEFIKAAGLVSGLGETMGRRYDRLCIFDYENERNMTPEDYHRKFTDCYTMNALSVVEQYHGDEVGAPATDSNDYMDLFRKYQRIGKTIGISKENQEKAVMELYSFFRSVLYQTENSVYNTQMAYFFNQIIAQLFSFCFTRIETESWGTLEIEEPKTRYQTIF